MFLIFFFETMDIDISITISQVLCSQCREVKSSSCFTPSEFRVSDRRKKPRHRCKTCKIKEKLKINYNITLEEQEYMINVQEKKCKICKQIKPLCVDHCHSTMKVRGLLCHSCNLGIGKFNDNPQFLREAAVYIEENK
jgi:hypothetical protein